MQIDGLALDQLDGFLAEETGDDELFYFWRGGDDGGKCGGGIGADGYGDLQAICDLVGANGDVFGSWQSFYPTQPEEGLNGALVFHDGRQCGAPAVSAMMATRADAASSEPVSADWRRRSR